MAAADHHKWAKPADWARHRELITDLYEGQNLTLKALMQVMRDEHHFFATEKMYKARFSKWGLQKKFSYKKLQELLREQREHDATEPKSEFSSQRNGGDTRHVGANHQRAFDSESTSDSNNITETNLVVLKRSQSPAPSVLDAPEVVRVPDECMRILRNYVSGSFDAGFWKPAEAANVQDGCELITWSNSMWSVVEKLRKSQTSEAFRIIHSCMDNYKHILSREDHRLFAFFYFTIVPILLNWPEVGYSILKYARDLSHVTQQQSHPLRLLSDKMFHMRPEEMREYAFHILNFYLDCFDMHLDPSDAFYGTMPRLRSIVINNLASGGVLDADDAIASFHSLIAEVESGPLASHAPMIKTDMGNMLLETGHLEESRQAFIEAVSDIRQTDAPEGRKVMIEEFGAFMLCRIALKEGDHERILTSLEKYLSFPLTKSNQQARVKLYGNLESYLRRKGDLEGLERVRNDHLQAVEDLCTQLSGTTVS